MNTITFGVRPCAYLILVLQMLVAHQAAAVDRTPQEVLRFKGLTLVGSKYLLEHDAALADWLRQVRAAEAKVADYTKRRTNLERELASMQEVSSNLYDSWQSELDKLHHLQKDAYASYNRQVDKVNGMLERLKEQLKVIDQRQAALGKLPDPTDEYVAIVVKFGAVIEQTTARYEKLAADAEVTAAIDAANKSSKAVIALGPSERWTKEMPSIRFMVNKVNTDTINFIGGKGGVPRFAVVFNGEVTVDAVFDSGASYVSISEQTAKKLKLSTPAGGKVIHIVTADGSVREVHVATIKSVRLGKFVVENVECVITPSANGREVDTLLGGTFLRRFVYKMDLSAGQLKLSQVGERPADSGATASAVNPSSTANPSSGATPASTANPSSTATTRGDGSGSGTMRPPTRVSSANLSPGLRFESYDGDNFERKIGERLDARIASDWGDGAPAPGAPVDHFTVRWSGYIRAPQNGRYKIRPDTDDGGRVSIGGKVCWDHWESPTNSVFEVDLTTAPQPFVMEVHEKDGGCHAALSWGPADGKATLSIIPASAFMVESDFASARSLQGHGLHRTIFGDESLEKPLMNDLDPSIDYFLRRNAMAENMPQDHYSVRWTGYLVAPEPGDYQLTAYIDDGMRLWVDGNQVIDQWEGKSHKETALVTLDSKPHALRVEYFQQGGDAHVSLHWMKVGGFGEHPIPPSAFFPTSEPALRAIEQAKRSSGSTAAVTQKRLAEIAEYRKRVGEPASPFSNPLDVTSPIEGDATLPAAAGGYKLSGTLLVGYNESNHGKDHKAVEGHLVIQPGFMLEGGKLIASKGVLELRGEPSRPIILRHVVVGCELGGQIKATHVIFEDCKLSKAGAWFVKWFSSKWELNQCAIIRSSFNGFNRSDYGFKIDRCTFVSSAFASRINQPAKEDDTVKAVHSEWGHIADCEFYGCQFANSTLWLLQQSNLYGCSVHNTAVFQSEENLTVELGLAEEERPQLPAAATAMVSSNQAGHLTIKPAAQLFPTQAFPILAEAPTTPPVLPPAPVVTHLPPAAPTPGPAPVATTPAGPTTRRGSSIFDIPESK